MSRVYVRIPTEELLLRKRRINQATGCWEWTGSTTVNGYGQVYDHSRNRARQVSRVAARLWLEFPDDDPKQFICHTCDNRICFNPAHLYVGSGSDNAQDRETRHSQSGERNHSAKLTWRAVDEIRWRVQAGFTQTEIASEVGVSRRAVGLVISGKTWSQEKTGLRA